MGDMRKRRRVDEVWSWLRRAKGRGRCNNPGHSAPARCDPPTRPPPSRPSSIPTFNHEPSRAWRHLPPCQPPTPASLHPDPHPSHPPPRLHPPPRRLPPFPASALSPAASSSGPRYLATMLFISLTCRAACRSRSTWAGRGGGRRRRPGGKGGINNGGGEGGGRKRGGHGGGRVVGRWRWQ